jgi:hypothetical protein
MTGGLGAMRAKWKAAGRVIRGRYETTTVTRPLPDAQAISVAGSMAVATNTFSPMSAGVHSPGASARGFVGDRGYGVNRFAGRTDPKQAFGPVTAPVLDPASRAVGIGAGVSGQPGLPNTGTGATPNPLVWMSAFQVGPGMSS